LDKLFRGLLNKEKPEEMRRRSDLMGAFKEVAFNSRTKKTLVKDGNRFIVVSGTDKSFLDTLRTLKYIKFESLEKAVEFFRKNGEDVEGEKVNEG